MRYLLGFLCACALSVLPLAGCSETSGDGGSGGSAGDGGSGGTAGVGGEGGMTCFQDDECIDSLICCHLGSPFTQGTCETHAACDELQGGTGGDGGLYIAFVAWQWVDPCDINASGQGLEVQIYAYYASGAPADQVTYSGQVQDCTGDLNAMETTLSCEVYLGARQGEATVTDLQGNEDTMFFAPEPCTNDCEPGCPGKGQLFRGERLTTDQRGVTRPQGAAFDVGALEMEVAP